MKQLRTYKADMKLKVKVSDRNVGVSILNSNSIYEPKGSSTKTQKIKDVSYCGHTAIFKTCFGKDKGKTIMTSDTEFKKSRRLLRPNTIIDLRNGMPERFRIKHLKV